MIPRRVRRFCLLPAFCLAASTASVAAESPLILSVEFGKRDVFFSGRVDSEETGQALADAVKAVRPDLGVVNKGLAIDPEAAPTDLGQLKSLLAELGLATHEGRLEIREDTILLGGLADSLVTMTALNLRIAPILEGRRLVNRVCVVNTDDLPDISVNLASGELPTGVLDFDIHPSAEESFQAPGLVLEKLFPALMMLSDFNRLEGKEPLKASPLRAMPVTGAGAAEPGSGEAPGVPPPLYEALETIRFSRNTFFLQANQRAIVEAVAEQLKEPSRVGRSVTLEAVKASGGSGAFNEYTCERRLAETKRLFKEHGVPKERFVTRITQSTSPVDTGDVRVLVDLPDPETEVEPESEEAPLAAGEPEGEPNGADDEELAPSLPTTAPDP
ncbi:MAG: hypothetical protein WD342_10305 [Verrucomicrobiales bacterium]